MDVHIGSKVNQLEREAKKGPATGQRKRARAALNVAVNGPRVIIETAIFIVAIILGRVIGFLRGGCLLIETPPFLHIAVDCTSLWSTILFLSWRIVSGHTQKEREYSGGFRESLLPRYANCQTGDYKRTCDRSDSFSQITSCLHSSRTGFILMGLNNKFTRIYLV